MENFEKLKENLPEIAKIVATFPEPLQGKVYDTLISELLGEKGDTGIIKSKKDNLTPPTPVHDNDELSAIATLIPDGQYHLSIRDLKATNAKDAVKRLVYVIIRSYTQLMNSAFVSRKDIINPELSRWRLADGNSRNYIAIDRGIIKNGDQLCLDHHAQNEADQFILDIKDSEKTGTWKPGSGKRQRRVNGEPENNESRISDNSPSNITEAQTTSVSSNVKPQTHSLDEVKTTSTIAQILTAKTEMDLILSAAMKFCLVESKETFNRAEILKEMQTATSYYQKSFLNNATKYLKKLVVKGKLRENGPDKYALSADTKKELSYKLGLE